MDEFDTERSESIKIAQIIGIIICFVCIVGLIFTLIFIRHESRTIQNDINSKQNDNEIIQLSIDEQNIRIEKLNSEINENIDVDKLTSDSKELLPKLINQLETNIITDKVDAKIAYITFDGGPSELTNYFLDVLDEHGIKATFFLKDNVDEDEEIKSLYSESIKRIITSGNSIGYLLEENNIENFNSFKDNLKINYCYDLSYIRFVNGSSSIEEDETIIDDLIKNKLGYVDYNQVDGDSEEYLSVDQAISNVVDTTNNRKILVVEMHDSSSTSLSALPYIIEGLREQGYTFLPIVNESNVVIKNKTPN